MWKALVYKEMRDVLPIACIALLAYVACVADLMGYPVFFGADVRGTRIPFINSEVMDNLFLVFICYPIALGLWQTVAENHRGTWLFLLHRPARRQTIIGIKLAVGIGCYLVVSATAILIYALWAATPGTHASPFGWWMTGDAWYVCFFFVLVYLGAFLSGIRPGHWFGSRLIPLLAVVVFAWVIFQIPYQHWIVGMLAMLLFGAIEIGVIFYSSKTRDFS